MRSAISKKLLVTAALLPATLGLLMPQAALQANDEPYQKGSMVQMDSVQCGTTEKGNKKHSQTHALLCQQYTIRADAVLYKVQPKDEKHIDVLPAGSSVEFRLEKNKMVLHLVGDKDTKNRDYLVISSAAAGADLPGAGGPPAR